MNSEFYKKFLLYSLLALVVLMPFHAFLTTWLGTALDIRFILQAWKEVLLLLMLAASGILVWQYPDLRAKLFRSKLFRVIGIYAALHLLLVLVIRNPAPSEVLALKYNLGFLVAFLMAVVASYFITDREQLEERLVKILLATSAVVAAFAVIQAVFLPADWLTHFGYGPDTIAPYQTIQDIDTVRVISTLGGPNQLGSFLLLPFALSLYLGLKQRAWRLHGPLLALFTLALFFSHSRSAWIGVLVAAAVVIWIALDRKTLYKLALAATGLAVVAGGLIAMNIERAPALQSALLHSNYEKAFTASSNVDHLLAMADGAETTLENPAGAGPGSAGPASEGTPGHLIAESYYFQISTEVGLLGLVLFISIMYLVSKMLYRLGDYRLVIPLLASFWGIAFFNFLLHGWTDSSTALIWWSVAGLVVTPLLLAQEPTPEVKDGVAQDTA